MNKRQLIVMWIGIGIIVLMGVFPPHMATTHPTVDFTRLLTLWGIVLALMTGFIITFKDREGK
jgi:hypothetical protein